MDVQNHPSTYQTSDLALIAYLRASGRLRFLTYEMGTGRRVIGVFEDPSAVGYAIRDEFNKQRCPIDAKTYYATLRSIRRELDDVKDRTGVAGGRQ